ncbi:MAG: hypothetical protein AABX31_00010 [Nanoarchaeota archaeon]
MEENKEEVLGKKYNISCCRSYLTPKGRCYTCPELEEDFELEGEEKIQRDPDEEQW